METMVSVLAGLGAFVAGVVARFSLLLLVLAVVAVPVFVGLSAINLYAYLRRRVLGLVTAEGVLWKDALYYAPGHTWMRRLGLGALRVGLDDLAGRLLAGPCAVELPRPGRLVRAGEVVGTVTCGDKRGDIHTPVGGRITAVNTAVARDPSLIHDDPYARGWLFTVAPADARYRTFPRGERARLWLEQESLRFARFLERDLGVAAADGGEVVSPPPSLLTHEQWRALTRAFLSTN